MIQQKPDYNRIYSDILTEKLPHLKEKYSILLNKKDLSVLDVLEINKKIFGIPTKDTEQFNQQHHSYNKSDIFEILNYQKRNQLNNSQLAKHFKLSRNTVTKWKKMFLI
ncbi:helix-turn-helix domain-containing protein [Chryseobacterium sp. RP-3-3]|uniref:Helix-turn-helix domain-containing protein n=1 Tax=Chryseobacterium antibioticum TaxID=2728847 RepID=A0A7Y0ANX2_9FLAO|nr:helix-turn-helix domain-containing protein [Chryseobacterium antibioticum]NML70811.1 helix-turn-helix domain-containing protein [Chryseobacterium antibioticum]